MRAVLRLGRIVAAQLTPQGPDLADRATLRLLRRLTFELTGRRRQDAKPGLAKMYRVPPSRAWWPAVGAPVERGVRPQCAIWNRRRARRVTNSQRDLQRLRAKCH